MLGVDATWRFHVSNVRLISFNCKRVVGTLLPPPSWWATRKRRDSCIFIWCCLRSRDGLGKYKRSSESYNCRSRVHTKGLHKSSFVFLCMCHMKMEGLKWSLDLLQSFWRSEDQPLQPMGQDTSQKVKLFLMWIIILCKVNDGLQFLNI